jgi:5S rRNA maturation endonuclease (ribonuclease M5)
MNDVSILEILNKLNISYLPSDLRGNELGILCPFHSDKHKGSFSINIVTGKFNCYSCKTGGKSIITFVAKYLNISYKEAGSWIGLNSNISQNYAGRLRIQKWKEVENSIIKKTDALFYPRDISDINVKDWYFFRERNINQIFVDYFCWGLCDTGFYRNYIIIPVQYQGEIFSFEARKLMQYEMLCKYFRQRSIGYKRHQVALQERFDNLNIDAKASNNFVERYIGSPKVLYARGSRLKETIYNYDNLNKKEPLHLVESVSSLSNIWNNVSTNCSATFGSKISKIQIELLKEFKDIILYPDNDDAGALMTESLNYVLKKTNLYIRKMKKDAARASKEELNQKPISAGKWVFNKIKEIREEIK